MSSFPCFLCCSLASDLERTSAVVLGHARSPDASAALTPECILHLLFCHLLCAEHLGGVGWWWGGVAVAPVSLYQSPRCSQVQH